MLTVAGLASAAALGVWPSAPARVGLAVYALFFLLVLRERAIAVVLRVSWAAVGAGLLAMAGTFLLFGLAAGHVRIGERRDAGQMLLNAADAVAGVTDRPKVLRVRVRVSDGRARCAVAAFSSERAK